MSVQGLQRASDFFRGERAKIRITLVIVKIIGGLLLAYMGVLLLNTFVSDVFTISNILVVLEVLFFFAMAILIALFTYIGMLVGYIFLLTTALLGNTTVTNGFQEGMTFLMRSFFEEILFNGFNLTNAGLDVEAFLGSGSDPFGPLAYMLLYSTRITYEKLFINGVLTITLILMFITGINFIIQGNMSQAAVSFILSQLILGFGYMNSLVRRLTLDSTSISSLLGSTMFQFGLFSYIYLEYSLQTAYLNNIAKPALLRQKRVGKQLESLSRFKLGITRVGTVEEQSKDKLMKQEEEKEGEKVSTALSAGTDSTTNKKFGAEAMAFLLDSSKDSVFHGATGEKEKMTGRLQRYHDGLLRHDKNLNKKLGGSGGKSFNPITTLIPVIISMTIRLVLLIFTGWLILNADIFFANISFPKTLTESIEFNQPESIILVLIPLIFLILGLSLLISSITNYFTKSHEFIISEAQTKKFIKKGVAIRTRKEGEELLKSITPQDTKKGDKSSKVETTPKKRKRKRKKPSKK